MKTISRRRFLKYCIGSATMLGLDLSVVAKLEGLLASSGAGLPTVIWINGANCTGCTVSLANYFSLDSPSDIADLLTGYLNLAFHPNLMGAAGDLAMEQISEGVRQGDFILAVDGGIPTAFGGHTCTVCTLGGRDIPAKKAVEVLAPMAASTLCIGTCASFGGIPSGNPNPTGIRTVQELTGVRTINIPGCPPHPDWIVWTVAQLLAGTTPALDADGRPLELFHPGSRNVHKNCPRKGREEAHTFGEQGLCLKEIGCKGPRTQGDCPTRRWNSGTNWCVGANTVCLGCTEKGFPDRFSPFFKFEEHREEDFDEEEERGETLFISKAEWKTDDSELRVEGRASKSAVVILKNAATGGLLALSSVSSDARWRFRLRGLKRVPCGIRVECRGEAAVRGVHKAPSECL